MSLAFSCQKPARHWDGLPDGLEVACAWDGSRATCVGGGREFACVAAPSGCKSDVRCAERSFTPRDAPTAPTAIRVDVGRTLSRWCADPLDPACAVDETGQLAGAE